MGEPVVTPVFNQLHDDALLPLADGSVNDKDSYTPLAWLVGCHGGAGVTTLATALAPFGDAGREIPVYDTPNQVLLVAEVSKRGLRAAHQAVLQFETDQAGGVPLVGVILVHRVPGKLPKALRGDHQRVVEATPGGHVWEVPFIQQWQENHYDALPEWEPGDEPPEKKRFGKKVTPMQAVPAEVADLAESVFDRAGIVFKRNR